MSNYVKPQSPIYNRKTDTYLYPLTTADQVIMPDGSRFTNINIEGAIQKNYSVVDNLTKPKNENEFTQNMIWIDTDISIGRVFFTKDEPNEILVDGDIWIATGNSSDVAFDALRVDNEYMNKVYPISAKQYIGGVWVNVTAKSYQNGEWVDWFYGTLYAAGDDGSLWERDSTLYISSDPMRYNTGLVTFGAEYISLEPANITPGNLSNISAIAQYVYDFSSFSDISITAEVGVNDATSQGVVLCIRTIPDGEVTNNVIAALQLPKTGSGTYTLQIPSDIKSGYVFVYANAGRWAKISNMKLI